MRLLCGLLVFAWVFAGGVAEAQEVTPLLKEFQESDYRDVNKLRRLLEHFEKQRGGNLKSAPQDELLYATDVATCLWNITDSPDEQKKIAQLGYKWAQELYARNPDHVDAIYFMGLNMLMYTQSKGVLDTLFALRKVKEYNELAYKKDPKFLYSSPPIGLGALYLFAPGFPVAFGDIDIAEKYLVEAAKTAPKNTTAWLLLGAVMAKKGDRERSITAFKKVLEIPGWTKPTNMYDKDMDFWWHVDQIRAMRALKAYQSGADPKKAYDIVDRSTREIRENYLPNALAAEKARK